MSWDQLLEPGLHSHHSDVETERFGCRVGRMTIGPGPMNEDELLAGIRDDTSEVLIVRYDAARLDLPAILARSRRTILPAGALVYWEKQIGVHEEPSPSDLEVRAADTWDTGVVSQLVREIIRSSFRDYGNHYAANPLFDRAAVLAGYEDWGVRSLIDDPRNVLVLTDRGAPIGLATLESAADGTHVEILLAGLVPAAQGKGLYATLLGACESLAASRGANRIVTSTQVHNVRVQRAWALQGLRPYASIETVHLVDGDLLLAASRRGRTDRAG
jgi:GNAT superfamily N-acetyltransferase